MENLPKPPPKKDPFGDAIVTGFIVSLVSAALYGFTGLPFFMAVCLLGILPFILTAAVAALGQLYELARFLFTGGKK